MFRLLRPPQGGERGIPLARVVKGHQSAISAAMNTAAIARMTTHATTVICQFIPRPFALPIADRQALIRCRRTDSIGCQGGSPRMQVHPPKTSRYYPPIG